MKDYLASKVLSSEGPKAVIPMHPLGDWSKVYTNYLRLFRRIHVYLECKPKSDQSHKYFARLAILWMRGEPLPKLIESAIQYKKRQSKNGEVNHALVIRETLKTVDKDLRFRYVKYLSCYISVLAEVLREQSFGQYLQSIPNLTLFMEFGASSQSMLSLIELGVSRTSASFVAENMLNKSMDTRQTVRWLQGIDLQSFDLPAASIRELSAIRVDVGEAAG